MEGNFVKAVVGLVLATVLVVNVLVPTFKGANTSGWTTSEIAIFSLASLGTIAGLVYAILAAFGIA